MGRRFRSLTGALGALVLLVLGLASTADPAAMALVTAAIAPAVWLLAFGSVALIFVAAGTPGRARTVVARALVPVMVVSLATVGYVYVDRREGNATVAAATERLLASLDPLPADADIYAVGEPYPGGRTFQLRQEDGTTSQFTTASATWFFMVDLAPTMLRGHPIRYAFLDDSGARWEDAEWFAFVDGAPSWTLTSVTAVRGYDVGVLAPGSVPTSIAPADPIARLAGDLERGREAAAADGDRKAIVVDGGDKWIDTPTGMPEWLWLKLKQIEARIEMRRAADELQRQLIDRGYDVTRFAAGFAKTGAAPPPTRDAIVKAVQDGVAGLKSGQELYLHVIAHGGVGGVAVYTEGDGPAAFRRDVLGYADLAAKLKEAIAKNPAFDANSGLPMPRIVVAIDACRSGSARDVLGDIPGVSLHTATTRPDELTRAGVNEGDPTDRRMYTRSMLKALAGPYGADVEKALRAADDARGETTLLRAEAIVLTGASPSPGERPSPTPRPAATFTVATVTDAIRAKWASESYPVASMACDRNGAVQSPATFTCSYLTPEPAIGGVKVTLKTDGTYAWEDAPGFFDMNYVLTILKQQWSGTQLASITCDAAGFVQGPAQVGCSFTDSVASGNTAITLNGDGSWRWKATYAQAAAAPVTVATPAPARVTQAPAAACGNPYENTTWSGPLALDFYGSATYNTTITFTFGRATSGDCETVRVASAQASDASRTWRLDTASGITCLYHRAAPVGSGAYARCETMELSLKLRLVSGAPAVGVTSSRPGGYAIDPLSVRIRNSGSQVLTPTRISGPGGAGCCEWGTFSATRR